MSTADLNHGRVSANGIEFAYLEAGAGPLILCLHGFPDSAWTWIHLLPRLAEAGFHAVAPWLRGYSPTQLAPDGCYQGGALVADALAVHAALGGDERAAIVGHDWGAYAAYGAAASAPERWRRVVTLSVPPPAIASRGFLDYDQLKRSWYHFFFQHPLAEDVVLQNDHEFIERLWADWSPRLGDQDALTRAKEALPDRQHVSAALGYYRALLDPSRHDPTLAKWQEALAHPISQPTLYIHGIQDGAFPAALGLGSEEFLGPGSRILTLEDAGHFPHLEQPARVAEEVIAFIVD